MNGKVKTFSFFGLPLRVYNLEKLVGILTQEKEALQTQVSNLETQLTNLTDRVAEIEGTLE